MAGSHKLFGEMRANKSICACYQYLFCHDLIAINRVCSVPCSGGLLCNEASCISRAETPLIGQAHHVPTALFIEVPHVAPCVSQCLPSAIQLLHERLHHGKLGEVTLVERFHARL